MVTTPAAREDSQVGSFRKVSKPLMEKKRRARINVSLEQLKSLLEKNYSQNIRKRKLEKADILELTVKYLKSLQSSLQGAPVYRSAEYQAGFRNCLSGVSEFLLRSEGSGERVVRELARVGFSTKDSGTSLAPSAQCEPQLPPTAAPASKPSAAGDAQHPSRDPLNERTLLAAPNGSRSSAHHVWRPW